MKGCYFLVLRINCEAPPAINNIISSSVDYCKYMLRHLLCYCLFEKQQKRAAPETNGNNERVRVRETLQQQQPRSVILENIMTGSSNHESGSDSVTNAGEGDGTTSSAEAEFFDADEQHSNDEGASEESQLDAAEELDGDRTFNEPSTRASATTSTQEEDEVSAAPFNTFGSRSTTRQPQQGLQQLQQRDNHSYLPGPSHPLLNAESLQHNNSSQSTSPIHVPSNNAMQMTNASIVRVPPRLDELPILELPGLVLFPGCSIPIRLQNRSWIQHLGRQIDASRRIGSQDFGQTVQLGILTQEESFAVHTQNARRRSSALRRGVVRNSQQMRRLSQILQQELLGDIAQHNDNSDSDSNNDSDNDENDTNNARNRHSNTSSRTQRNLHPFIGRVGTIATVTYTHGDAVLDDNTSAGSNNIRGANSNNTNNDRSNRRVPGVWQQHAETQTELILQAVGTERFRIQSYLEMQSFAEVQVFQVENFHEDKNPLKCPFTRCWTGIQRQLPVNPLLMDTDDDDIDLSGNSVSTSNNQQSSSPPPPLGHPTKYFLSHHESLIRQLSMVTPIPYIAYKQVWPWRLVGQIVDSIQTRSQNAEQSAGSLLVSLAEMLRDKTTSSLIDHPTNFSFWLASNMPLSVEEKMSLLKLPSTVERLQRLQEHLQKYHQEGAVCTICCSSCRVPLSNVDHVFTVGGAEGTTANYVNEHGFIHQVVTLRQIDEQEVMCVGGASTENSYFPGYGWTIAYCQRCGSLLGWKFHWVGGRHSSEKNRPDSFFGFNASSLITESE